MFRWWKEFLRSLWKGELPPREILISFVSPYFFLVGCSAGVLFGWGVTLIGYWVGRSEMQDVGPLISLGFFVFAWTYVAFVGVYIWLDDQLQHYRDRKRAQQEGGGSRGSGRDSEAGSGSDDGGRGGPT